MLDAIGLVIDLAHDHSLETRIRRLLIDHSVEGTPARTLVMNATTWHALIDELEGRTYSQAYYWYPQDSGISRFLGVPILVKDYVADMEVLVGV